MVTRIGINTIFLYIRFAIFTVSLGMQQLFAVPTVLVALCTSLTFLCVQALIARIHISAMPGAGVDEIGFAPGQHEFPLIHSELLVSGTLGANDQRGILANIRECVVKPGGSWADAGILHLSFSGSNEASQVQELAYHGRQFSRIDSEDCNHARVSIGVDCTEVNPGASEACDNAATGGIGSFGLCNRMPILYV